MIVLVPASFLNSFNIVYGEAVYKFLLKVFFSLTNKVEEYKY